MKTRKSTKRALLLSICSILLCLVMLIGTTFAWFTDTASTAVNTIQSGTLDIVLEMKKADGTWESAEGKTLDFVKAANAPENEAILWEPGCTYTLPELRIRNNGNLALKYKVQINGIQGDAKLNEAIVWTVSSAADTYDLSAEHHLPAKTGEDAPADYLTISGHMKQEAGNEYQGLTISGASIIVYATQDTVEYDSNNNTYDKNAAYAIADGNALKAVLAEGGNVTVSDTVKTSGEDTADARVIIGKPTTLTLNEKIVSPDDMGNNNTNFVALIVDADTTINAGANGGIDTGTNGGYAINVRNGATLTINGGSYYGGGTAVQVQKGTLVINGGFFAVEPYSNPVYGYKYLLNCIDSAWKDGTAKIIVKGGTFVNFDPSDSASENPHGNFVADGCSVITETKENGDVWYTVVNGTAVTNSAELTATVASAPEGSTIVLGKNTTGTYKLENTEPLTLKNLTFTAAPGVSVNGLQLAASSKTAKVTLDNITFDGISFTDKVLLGQSGGTYGYSQCSNITFTGCTFDMSSSTETYKDAISRGAVAVSGTIAEKEATAYLNGLTIENCEFKNGRYAVYGGKARNVTVSGCRFSNLSANALRFEDVAGSFAVSGNTADQTDGMLTINTVGNNYSTTDVQTTVTIQNNVATNMTCDNGYVFYTTYDNARKAGKSTYTITGNQCTYTQAFENPLNGFRIKSNYGPSTAEFIENN